MQVKSIAASNIVEYSEKLAEALLEGYKLDFSIDSTPRHFASLYSAFLVKDEAAPSEIDTNDSSPISAPSNSGRNSKVQKGV